MTTVLSFPIPVHPLNDVTTYLFSRHSMLPYSPDFLWQIESGIVRTLTWFEDGTVVTLGLWGEGDIVGSALSTMNPYDIECLTDVKVKKLPREQWHEATEAMVLHIQRSEEFLKIVHCKQIELALLQLLNWLAKRFGRAVDEGQRIEMRLTHQEIAEIIGATRVTITRTLSNLKKQGVLLIHERFMILSPDRQDFWHYEI
ncbi:Crp/Fnr family transcriptional regulator [Tumidithrix helvetica PCC 7403]|uniref:Crp/Fnr family transcriptional regulator n=1 Tax=Tumidithrix helvetica TaxID=3457545 RepID=UPI003CAD3F68